MWVAKASCCDRVVPQVWPIWKDEQHVYNDHPTNHVW
ncbi:MAG: hypothetical protein ACI9AX_000873, partial [Polaromonas sp.]